MMRSGRILNAFRTRSVAVIAPVPSILDGRVSSRTTCSCCNCSSAASSIVTHALVVLNKAAQCVQQRRLSRTRTAADDDVQTGFDASLEQHHHLGGKRFEIEQTLKLDRVRSKRRIETQAPSKASGGIIALTREPSSNRASTIGHVSSTRRPTLDTIRSMICIK